MGITDTVSDSGLEETMLIMFAKWFKEEKQKGTLLYGQIHGEIFLCANEESLCQNAYSIAFHMLLPLKTFMASDFHSQEMKFAWILRTRKVLQDIYDHV